MAGDAANDMLEGGSGDDSLTGGAGNDAFNFTTEVVITDLGATRR
jgi:Ca2+-binding RTX toxin-like protein